MKRIPISKSVRFSVFSRDGFTCRYCGKQSDSVKLEVDHIQPVCQGGTNDIENLITSCFDCNRGKAGKTIAQSAPTENDRLRINQEHQEQLATLEAAKKSARARFEFRQEICEYICSLTGRDSCNKTTLNIMCRFAETYGCCILFEWLDIAHAAVRRPNDERQIGMYVCGIRRKFDLQMSDASLDDQSQENDVDKLLREGCGDRCVSWTEEVIESMESERPNRPMN